MKLYKVLKRVDDKLISPFKNYEYTANKKLTCKNFNIDPTIDCAEGYYATDIDGLIYTFRNLPGYEVWRCTVGGKSVEIDQFKRRYEWIKLLENIPNEEVKNLALMVEPDVGYRLSEALFPVHPFKIEPPAIGDTNIALLKQWDSVGDSVGDSVWASVGDSVGDPVGASVWASVGVSVRDSVGDSVWDSVWAYISSLFPNITQWNYITHPAGENPFQPAITLWHKGLLPVRYQDTWHLYGKRDNKVCSLWNGKI